MATGTHQDQKMVRLRSGREVPSWYEAVADWVVGIGAAMVLAGGLVSGQIGWAVFGIILIVSAFLTLQFAGPDQPDNRPH
jgi:hypothetical protein